MRQLTAENWYWIIGFLILAFGFSLYHARRSSQSIEDYFAAGRNAPWWLLGTSIVATTFASDTPLVVAGLVMTKGIAGNWIWWAVLPSGMLGVFFFASMWRRSGCLTQAELAILRYGGKRAKILRLFNVIYHGVVRNAAGLGFVNLAMAKIITFCTDIGHWEALTACFFLTTLYTVLGGIRGVMWTDLVQFGLALGSSVALAYFAVQQVGGLDQLSNLCRSGWLWPMDAKVIDETIAVNGDYIPAVQSGNWYSFLIFITIYWSCCTPTDCHGYAVQRLLSARDERHAIWGYLWYNAAHYVVRPWPWILVGLVAVMVNDSDFDPGVAGQFDPEHAYVQVLMDAAPAWLIGPALAGLLAAYMSTIDTHLNWGASYLINDLYKPYVRPSEHARHYVTMSRTAVVIIALLGMGATLMMDSITQGWGLVFGLFSGMGVVGILRWLWWRTTAWTEIGCMSCAGLATWGVHSFLHYEAPFSFLITVPCALVGAAIGTWAFAPESDSVLQAFCDKVDPPGPGWRAFRRKTAGLGTQARSTLWISTICWIASTIAVFLLLFGVGDVLIKDPLRGAILILMAIILAGWVGWMQRPASDAVDPRASRVTPE